MAQENQINRGIDGKNYQFLCRLYYFIRDYEGQLPNLRDIFRPEAIEWLLTQSVKCHTFQTTVSPFVDFVINTGYKDEPKVGEDGKPLLHRTTPIHRAYIYNNYRDVSDLFKIYDRFDVNYTDEDGLTHFHVACVYGCDEIVQKFLELGQDRDWINCLLPKIGGSLLHLALEKRNNKGVKFLLRSGANPNLANKDGVTPLHIMCKYSFKIKDLAELGFEINSDKSQTLQINARDNLGNAPLHLAMQGIHVDMIEFLLRNGADPNIVNNEGFTPLHVFLTEMYYEDHANFFKMFFKINGELNQPVQVDAKDKLGRTPLQMAVVNLFPDCIDVLLDYGADLSCFVFPSESDFTKRYKYRNESFQFKLNLVTCLPIVIGCLARRGYQMDRNDALKIMQLFAKLSLFEKSADLEKDWANDEEFASKAKEIMMKPSLSLYDSIQLRTEEVAKLLTLADYYYLARSEKIWDLPQEGPAIEACARCLCEQLTRRFFRRLALDPLLELTKYQLPILCCDMIIEQLMNEDLSSICLAAAIQDS